MADLCASIAANLDRDAENRETAGATAPPQGLVLVKIVYKKEENKRTDC